MDPADPLHDASLALAAAGLDPATVRRVLASVRQRWAGRVYIRTRDPETDREISQRLRAGEHPADIARATGRHRTSIIRRRSSW